MTSNQILHYKASAVENQITKTVHAVFRLQWISC